MTLTIHARVELNKRLKKIHRARVPVRITFTPSSGCGFKTVHRSLSLAARGEEAPPLVGVVGPGPMLGAGTINDRRGERWTRT